ncbi:FKBP-type peptidyl-prolyl cis-trans isomerase [Acidiferrobacter sp.]|jgi:FKBP-type peptidyl-prolyl cis-trans isomerase SlpA|uniref:FKBP-type peptidyl-prolyl cis-trans isomerase n=1 Tax=Acidiferrobacter sp. TaxID=1872107 RepID=UPI0026264996|nr:FKBP-type peptidyl-prolyl cis-trans isomerase [Acidiferrobacter sp.]
MERVETGARVALRFTLSLADGTRVEGTAPGEAPWEVVVGGGDLPAGLDRCLIGLAVGERGRYFVAAADAYGKRDDNAREILPRADFPADVDLIPGMAFSFTLPDGREAMGQVMAVTAGAVEVDFTHPLAGQDLIFEVDIVAIGGH